jgi:hypothetical protein
LRDWTHVDCTLPRSLVDIDDVPLRALVESSHAPIAGRSKPKPVSKKRAAIESDEDEEDDGEGDVKRDASDEVAEPRAARVGGQVTFLFSRSTTATLPAEDAEEAE